MSDQEKNNPEFDETSGGNTEFTGSQNDQRLHQDEEYREINPREFESAGSEMPEEADMPESGDAHSNTGTGYHYSASARKEKFTDENYGGSGQYTRKDIENLGKDENDQNQ